MNKSVCDAARFDLGSPKTHVTLVVGTPLALT